MALTRCLLKLGHEGGGEHGLGQLPEELLEEAGHHVGLMFQQVDWHTLVVALLQCLHLRLHAGDAVDALARQTCHEQHDYMSDLPGTT